MGLPPDHAQGLDLLALRVHDDDFPLRAATETTAGQRVVLDDFTLWIREAWLGLPEGRLILGNPPYTRLQLLPLDQRDRLWEAAGGLCGRRASLSALITAMSLNALHPRDGLCLLLPAQWLESDYAQELRASALVAATAAASRCTCSTTNCSTMHRLLPSPSW